MSQLESEPKTLDLPSPEERPDADVVIFDGQCNICRGQIARLASWDGRGRLSYLSLHDPAVYARYPDLTHDELMEEMVVVDRRGRRHKGAAAFAYLTTRLWRLWLLAPILNFPGAMPLWRFCYRQVARRRYKLGGKTVCDSEACRRHAPR